MRLASLAILIYTLMLVEARRARRHERAQLARGGIEPQGDVYRTMQAAYPAAFGAMLVEGWLRGMPEAPVVAAGASAFLAAKALKWWAIVSLGPSWTFRVIAVPGVPLVRRGPYRFLRHPNYVAVLGELAATAAMTGAVVAGPIATVGFGALMIKRIAVEDRLLYGRPTPRPHV